MMDKYRSKMLEVHKIGDRLKADREAILNSGLHERKIREDLQALGDRARVEAKLVIRDLSMIANNRIQAAEEVWDSFRRKGQDPSLMLYNQNKAASAFSGLEPDEVLDKYGEVVGSLNAQEFEYLYVYEDTVRALLKDKAAAAAIESVIDTHKGQLEKAAIRELDNRKNFLDSDSTIRGLIEMDIDAIAKGESQSMSDLADILDKLVEGHGKNRQSVSSDDETLPRDVTEVKINPYDTE
jgi:hypothetical protein